MSANKWSLGVMILIAGMMVGNVANCQITIDGNPADWPAILSNNACFSRYIVDPVNSSSDDIFTGGGSKAGNDLGSWQWTTHNATDKLDIEHAGVAIAGTKLYCFADRYAVNGDAALNFWLLGADLTKTGGAFGGAHTDGDILLQTTFTSGGSTANYSAYMWQGGALIPLVFNSAQLLVRCNSMAISSPAGWGYVSKGISGTGVSYPANAFCEAMIDLAALTGPAHNKAFHSLVIATSTSQAMNSKFEDLVLTSFSSQPVAIVNNSAARVCKGGIITFSGSVSPGTGSGPFSYTWSTSSSCITGTCLLSTAQNFAPSSAVPGIYTYYFIAYSAGIPSAPVPISLTVNALPAMTAITGGSVCSGSQTSLTAMGGISYIWAPALGLSATTGETVTAMPAVTTTYTVTGMSAMGCVNTATATVNVHPLPLAGISADSREICYGTSTTLKASGGLSYSWQPADGLTATSGEVVVASPVATTIYTVYVTSENGCTGKAVTTVSVDPLPVIGAGTNTTICNSGKAILTATGGTDYFWLPSATLSSSTGSLVTASPTGTTTYTVSGGAGGCRNTATVTVSVNPNPVITAMAATNSICYGASVILTASGADLFSWAPTDGLASPAGAIVSASPAGDITYTVTGMREGCTGTATVKITVSVGPRIMSLGNTGPVCEGGTLDLFATVTGGNGNLVYEWSGPAAFTSSLVMPSIPQTTLHNSGAYTVVITDEKGCRAMGGNTTDAAVVARPVVAPITDSGALCVNYTRQLNDITPGGSWTSSCPAVAVVDATTGLVTGLNKGQALIAYTVASADNCTSTATQLLKIDIIPDFLYTYTGKGTNVTSGDSGQAAQASVQGPRAMTTDLWGNLYFCDVTGNRVRKIDTNDVISTVAGNGVAGYSGDGGPALSASLNMAGGGGIYVDKSGNMLISNTAVHTIRMVNAATGIITTICGTGSQKYSGDGGPATAASISFPLGITEDSAGNIYFADQVNYRVRRIDARSGIITTIIGTGSNYYSGDGGPGTAARLSFPRDVAIDKAGNMYIVDNGNNVIRKYVMSTGIITTYAGNGVAGYLGDGGPATAAEMNCPARAIYDGGRKLYISDQSNNRIRCVDLCTNIITTVVADGTPTYGGDGDSATRGQIWAPAGLAMNKDGYLFIADANNRRVRVAPYLESIILSVPDSSSTNADGSLTLTAFASISENLAAFQWQVNGANVGNGSTSYTASNPRSGDTYRCIMTVNPECWAPFSDTSNSVVIFAQHRPSGIAFPGGNELKLFPNPAGEYFILEGTGLRDGAVSIRFIDNFGRLVNTRHAEVSEGRLVVHIDLTRVSSGVYIVELLDSQGQVFHVKGVRR